MKIPHRIALQACSHLAINMLDNNYWVQYENIIARQDIDLSVIDNFSISYGAEFIANEFGILKYRLTSLENVIPYSNALFENGLSEWSQPDFLINVKKYTSESQYYLDNKQNDCNYNHDINALEAWQFTKGCPNINVAVIDDGLEEHPDLNDEKGNSRIIKGYTPSGVTIDGLPESIDYHGQACAGIIAASHNTNVKGIAPNIKLFAVKVRFGESIPSSEYANAIRWAYQNGADVLSNSWGGSSDQNVIDAIIDAQTYGRNGKGAIVVFSAGNAGLNEVNTYSKYAISVGAINREDTPAKQGSKRYTNIGTDLDLVAYGGDANSKGEGDIYTIDRVGSKGKSTSDYYEYFTGTSAACPQVSGAVALILSINPELTKNEVENILFESATDLGVLGRDDTYGYGKLNIFEALKLAISSLGVNVKLSEGVIPYQKISTNSRVSFVGKPECNIAQGLFFCDIYKAEETLPYSSDWFWFEGNGLSGANPNDGKKYFSLNGNKVTTFFYYVKSDLSGRIINKWVPMNPASLNSRKYLILPQDNIQSSAIISDKGTLQLFATNSIDLIDGFDSNQGSDFTAEIVASPNLLQCPLNNLRKEEVYPQSSLLDTSEIVYSLIPNPCQDNLKIIRNKGINENIRVLFYSIEGKEKDSFILSQNELIVNVSAYEKGIYLVKIISENGLSTYKFIKE